MSSFNAAMLMLADRGAIFIGQNVAYDGVAMYHDLAGVPASQRIELPVVEELQLGICTGLAIQGFLPVCMYPRIDFMLRAADQLVNHLDKLEEMSQGQFCPKVIIRTRVGTKTPLYAGPQHTQDHTEAFRQLLTNITVIKLTDEAKILATYQEAMERHGSTLVIEHLCC